MNLGRAVIAVGCTYELLALPESSPLPTITNIVAELRRTPHLKWAAWVWVGVWSAHFLSD